MNIAELRGILESLVVYYGLPFRRGRMRRMYSRFVATGDLAFDIGSHVGNRLRAFLDLGARVVAVEPNPTCVRLLRRFYGESVRIVEAAVGSTIGQTTLHVSTAHPTLASASAGWIETVRRSPLFAGIEWDKEVAVPLVTLDRLIEEFGEPRFVKVDVEGMEGDVLRGLSNPIPALSFEFLPANIDVAVESVRLAADLGHYTFNLSMVETMDLVLPRWVTAPEMTEVLRSMPERGRSGDVYAKLDS